MRKLFLIAGILMFQFVGTIHAEENVALDDLVKKFEANPANPQTTIQLLEELKKEGKSNQDFVNRYFATQPESDYVKDYNWRIIRDYVNDVHAPQFKYLFDHQDKFIENYSKDDVMQKLDDTFVNHLEQFYNTDTEEYNKQLEALKQTGYEHYDVVYDYFYIRELLAERNAEDYFYKARKLFRYFPENRPLIKKITAGALEIMTDVSRLKVIQLWAGKTVESQTDFEAIYNYVVISEKCGFMDVAKKYAGVAKSLADKSSDQAMKAKAAELMKLVGQA